MSTIRDLDPIHIGVVSDEPIRLEGLGSVFEHPSQPGKPTLFPVFGALEALLTNSKLEYLVVDLHSFHGGVEALEAIRRVRPSVRLIVIGPQGDDELVLDSIIAGARAYVELTAGPDTVRMAIDVVLGGSIWAPRRLLSTLIDRLLKVPDSSPTTCRPHLTGRERQVLDLILKARSNREIARHLGIEERTVKAHVGRLLRKAGAENRIELSMLVLNRSEASGGLFVDRRRGDRRKSKTPYPSHRPVSSH
jgi:DNA-binding NarL/FixJ family response regulator